MDLSLMQINEMKNDTRAVKRYATMLELDHTWRFKMRVYSENDAIVHTLQQEVIGEKWVTILSVFFSFNFIRCNFLFYFTKTEEAFPKTEQLILSGPKHVTANNHLPIDMNYQSALWHSTVSINKRQMVNWHSSDLIRDMSVLLTLYYVNNRQESSIDTVM